MYGGSGGIFTGLGLNDFNCIEKNQKRGPKWVVEHVGNISDLTLCRNKPVFCPQLITHHQFRARIRFQRRSVKRYPTYRTYPTNNLDPSKTAPPSEGMQPGMEGLDEETYETEVLL